MDRLRPGKRATASGQWSAHDAHGNRIPKRQATVTKGERLPPIKGYTGGTWRLTDETLHGGEIARPAAPTVGEGNSPGDA